MKKIIFLLVICAFLVVGCGNKNQVTCTKTETEDGVTATIKMIANLKDNKVSSVDAVMSYDDENTISLMCSMFAVANEHAESDSDKVDYKCNKNSIEIKNFDKMSDEDEKIIGITKEEFISGMESEGASCK